jgi:hypothetical protein
MARAKVSNIRPDSDLFGLIGYILDWMLIWRGEWVV